MSGRRGGRLFVALLTWSPVAPAVFGHVPYATGAVRPNRRRPDTLF